MDDVEPLATVGYLSRDEEIRAAALMAAARVAAGRNGETVYPYTVIDNARQYENYIRNG